MSNEAKEERRKKEKKKLSNKVIIKKFERNLTKKEPIPVSCVMGVVLIYFHFKDVLIFERKVVNSTNIFCQNKS